MCGAIKLNSYNREGTSKISIIVPIYNAGEYLRKCLDSICNQTYSNLEIICINGGSTDNSSEILKYYKEKDSRICIIDTENEGVSISRNKGLDVATGEYVIFVDADDWLDLETCVKALQEAEQEKADVVMWSYVREFSNQSLPKIIFKETKKVFEEVEVAEKIHRRFIGLVRNELAEVENADALCTVWGKLYRRDVIEKNEARFIDLKEIGTYEDGLFNLYVFEGLKKVVFINECLYHYRKDNSNSITFKFKPNLFSQWKNLFDYMENYIEEKQLPAMYREALNNRICLSILGLGLNVLGSREKYIEKIKRIISDKRYREAYKNFSLKYFPIHWKVFYGCAKYNFATGVYALLFCVQKMRGK